MMQEMMNGEYDDDAAIMDEENFFSRQKQIILAIVPMCTGLLSAIGSSMILFIILKDYKRKLRRTYHRLICCMSICDVLNSLRACSSSFMVPADTPGVFLTFGNTRTCNVHGFLTQLGIGTVTLYSANLAIYFLLVIRPSRGRVPGTTRAKNLEPLLLWFPLVYAFGTGLAGLALQAYNPVRLGIGCWVAAYPIGCLEETSTVECTSGQNSKLLSWLFGGIIIVMALGIVLFCMTRIAWTVRQQLRIMRSRYSVVFGQNASAAATARMRQTSVQASLYISAFILVYLWSSMSRIMENNGKSHTFFAVSLLSQIFYPLQGAFNCAIYIRPRYQELVEQYPSRSPLWRLRLIFFPDTAISYYGSEPAADSLVDEEKVNDKLKAGAAEDKESLSKQGSGSSDNRPGAQSLMDGVGAVVGNGQEDESTTHHPYSIADHHTETANNGADNDDDDEKAPDPFDEFYVSEQTIRRSSQSRSRSSDRLLRQSRVSNSSEMRVGPPSLQGDATPMTNVAAAAAAAAAPTNTNNNNSTTRSSKATTTTADHHDHQPVQSHRFPENIHNEQQEEVGELQEEKDASAADTSSGTT